MLENYLRPQYQKYCVDPFASWLATYARLSPNHITLLSAVTGVVVLPLLACQWPIVACLFLWFSGYLDTLDGTLARFTGRQSARGSVLDICADRVVEIAVVLGLYFMLPETRALPCLMLMASSWFCITSFLVVGIFTKNQGNKSFSYSDGLIERLEAFVFFSLMMLLPSAFAALAYAYAILVFGTGVWRVWQFQLYCMSLDHDGFR